MSPSVAPVIAIAGVLSDVMLSVDDDPRSEAATRSGADGAVGATVSVVMDNEPLVVDVFPAASVSVADTDHVPSVSAGRSHDVADPIT